VPKITVNNFDIISDYRKTRSLIGVVPQELTLEAFETVFDNVSYSRGLYGKSSNPQYIESLLKELSLWDKKSNRLRELSGGMKRRILIAKALSHEPKILFLDEPCANLDPKITQIIENLIKTVSKSGVKIIIVTHDLFQAKRLANDILFFHNGKIIEHTKTKSFFKNPKSKEAKDFQKGLLLK